MLDARFVRENLDFVDTALKNRGSDILLDEYADKYDSLKTTTHSLESLRHEKKSLSKGGRPTDQEIERAKELSQDIRLLEGEQRDLRDWIETFLLNLPNIPHSSVPIGKSEKDNVLVKMWGQKPIWSPEGVLLYNGAGKRVVSRFQLFLTRARAYLNT